MNHMRAEEERNISRASHGDRIDAGMDRQIKDLDRNLRVLNFGQPINHETFDMHCPPSVKKTNDAEIYRDWKQSQIFLKMA